MGGGSPTDILTRPGGKAALKHVVLTFTMVGVGIGLAALFGGEILNTNRFGGSGIAGSAFGIVIYIGGPLLAGAIGLSGVTNIGKDTTETYILSFVSSAAGYLAMTIVAGLFTAIPVSGVELGDVIVIGLLMAIVTGLTTVGVIWATNWSQNPAA